MVNSSHEAGKSQSAQTVKAERVPFMQRLLDNPFILLFMGVAFPTVLYTIWGIMEVTQIPIAK